MLCRSVSASGPKLHQYWLQSLSASKKDQKQCNSAHFPLPLPSADTSEHIMKSYFLIITSSVQGHILIWLDANVCPCIRMRAECRLYEYLHFYFHYYHKCNLCGVRHSQRKCRNELPFNLCVLYTNFRLKQIGIWPQILSALPAIIKLYHSPKSHRIHRQKFRNSAVVWLLNLCY